MPKRGLLAFTSWGRRGLSRHSDFAPAVAMPGLRPAVLCLERCPFIRAIRSLPALRKFRSPARRARTRRGRHFDRREALPRLSGLPLRPLPPEVFQLDALSPDRPVHDIRRLAESLCFVVPRNDRAEVCAVVSACRIAGEAFGATLRSRWRGPRGRGCRAIQAAAGVSRGLPIPCPPSRSPLDASARIGLRLAC
jgi:hypothetical protein